MVKLLEKAGALFLTIRHRPVAVSLLLMRFLERCQIRCTKFLKDFKGTDCIVSPSASCVGFVRNYYGKLFENSSLHHEVQDAGKRIFELSEFLIIFEIR
jgi:L-lactate dehydrogenase complex protein LldE